MKVYDCFPFFNELDLLEYRLELLYPHVDCFVLVEANCTHSGNPKPYYFLENKERFNKYLDKIVHRQINLCLSQEDFDNWDKSSNYDWTPSWIREGTQRNYISTVLQEIGVNDEDLVFSCDVDEIVSPVAIKVVKALAKLELSTMFALSMKHYQYCLHHTISQPWIAPKAACWTVWKHLGLSYARNFFHESNFHSTVQIKRLIGNAGWHLSYFGGIDTIKKKLDSFSHQEDKVQAANNYDQIVKNIVDHKAFQVQESMQFSKVIDEDIPNLTYIFEKFAQLCTEYHPETICYQ